MVKENETPTLSWTSILLMQKRKVKTRILEKKSVTDIDILGINSPIVGKREVKYILNNGKFTL